MMESKRAIVKKLNRLVNGVNPRIKVPRGFAFWSPTMQVAWLKQNQKKKKEEESK